MSLDFGNTSNNTKAMCFNVPNLKLPRFKIPNLNLKLPKIGLPSFGKLNFGKGTLHVTLPKIRGINISPPKLNFGDLLGKLKGLKLPQTICINVSNDMGLEDLINQISNILDSLIPRVTIPPLFQGGGISIIPPILINPTVPLGLSLAEALALVKDNCLESILNKLRQLDPLERLKKLFELAAELCAAMSNQIIAVIEEIQKAQAELIAQALSFITDPVEKLLKLLDMAADAITAGAYDLLQTISNLIGSTQYQGLLDFLDNLDPTVAIEALINEIMALIAAGNLAPVSALLSILQSLKAKTQGISDIASNLFNMPNLLLEDLINQLMQMMQQEDYLGAQRLLSDFMRMKKELIDSLRNLDPSNYLAQMIPMLNDALKNLNFALFNMLIKDLADKLCGTDTLPA